MAHIIGTPAGSMATAGFDQGSTRVGTRGEQIVAQILQEALSDSPATILHDLDLPDRTSEANVDHVIVADNKVLIIDSKCWKPAVYWRLNGRAMRGLKHFEAAEKRLLPLAHRLYSGYLPWARFPTPLMVVTPSSDGRCRTGLLRVDGAKVVPAHRARSAVRRALGWSTTQPADPAIIAALTPLVRR